jgi:hypothetical protein
MYKQYRKTARRMMTAKSSRQTAIGFFAVRKRKIQKGPNFEPRTTTENLVSNYAIRTILIRVSSVQTINNFAKTINNFAKIFVRKRTQSSEKYPASH